MIETASVLAEGSLYFNELVGGIPQGRVRFPGLAKLEIKANSELKESLTKDKGQYGQVVASAAINKPADLTVVINQITGKALAAALQGSVEAYSQGSGTVTAMALTAKLATFGDLGKRNIAAGSVIVTNDGATVTYVEGTDYNINYAMGFIEYLASGAITEAQPLKVTFDHNAVDGQKVKGATVPQIKGKLELDGNNLMDGKPLIVTIWEATLTSDSPVDFMSDDPISLTMKGRMATPAGKTSPIEVDLGLLFS